MRVLLTFLLACWPLAAVDLIFFSGGETGELTAEWGTTSASVNATRNRTGNFAIEITGNVETPSLGAGITEVWLACYVNVDVYPGSVTSTSLKIRDGPAGGQLSVLSTLTDGTLELEGTASTATLTADTYALIEQRYKAGTGSNAEHQLWINGTSEVNLSNGSQTGNVGAIDFEQFSDSGSTWLDDCAISSTGRIGAHEIIALRPNGDASPDTFDVTGAGSQPTWDDVDGVPGGLEAVAPDSGGPPVGQEWDLTTATVGTINASNFIARVQTPGGGGGSETIRPTATGDIVGYSACVVTDIDEDPDAEEETYCNGLSTDVDTEVDVAMGNPTVTLSTGTNEQEVRACFISSGEASDPDCHIDILEGNTVRVSDVFSGDISQTTCATVSAGTWSWVPADWTDTSGDSIEVGINCNAGGGSPPGRASGAVGSVELNLTTVSATTHKLIVNDDNNSDLLLGPALVLSSPFVYFSLKATGAAAPVSQADVDAYEVGAEQSAAGNPLMVVDVVWFMIDHDAVVAGGGPIFIITHNDD